VFTREELAKWILQVARQSTATRSSASSIKRDVDVFLKTYVPAEEDRRRPLEDSFDCPLAELGLIRAIEQGAFQFNLGSKPSLPIPILAFALIEFWTRAAAHQETLSIERVLYDPGSPGAAFKLGDKVLVAMLERLPESAGMRYDETAGLRVLIRTPAAASRPIDILSGYYATH
jgi:hypothetical protein